MAENYWIKVISIETKKGSNYATVTDFDKIPANVPTRVTVQGDTFEMKCLGNKNSGDGWEKIDPPTGGVVILDAQGKGVYEFTQPKGEVRLQFTDTKTQRMCLTSLKVSFV